MNGTLETGSGKSSDHPECGKIGILRPVPVLVVPLYVMCAVIIPVFPAQEELADLFRVVKPLVIVNVQEPFALDRKSVV